MQTKTWTLPAFALLALTAAPIAALAQDATAEQPAPAETGGAVTASNEGAYDALSPGGRKIARALEGQQPLTADGAATGDAAPARMTADDIAAAKQDGSGWGQVFKQMQADGLTTEKNLGQVISGGNKNSAAVTETSTSTATAGTSSHAPAPSAAPSKPVIISLGNGATMAVGGGAAGSYGGRPVGGGYAKVKGDAPVTAAGGGGSGVRTASNGNAGGNGNGNGYGHAAGLSTASGGGQFAAGAGAQAGVSNAGGNGNGNGGGNGLAKGKTR